MTLASSLLFCGRWTVCCLTVHCDWPSYLYNLISVQRHHITRSSDVVTLSRPPFSSSLKVNNRSFRHASLESASQATLPAYWLWRLVTVISSHTRQIVISFITMLWALTVATILADAAVTPPSPKWSKMCRVGRYTLLSPIQSFQPLGTICPGAKCFYLATKTVGACA